MPILYRPLHLSFIWGERKKKKRERERETERERRVPKERRCALTKWAQTEEDTITHKQEHSWLHSYRGWGYRVSNYQTLLLLPSPTGINFNQTGASFVCLSRKRGF